jgi:hypothetical protein
MRIKVLISTLLACYTSCAITQAQVGKPFPTLTGETLEQKEITLPEGAAGKLTLLGLAYSKKSEDVLKTWYTPLYDKFVLKRGMFDSQYDINMHFIPMYTGMKKAAYEATLKELRESNRKDLFPYILFYKGSLDPYEESLKLDDPGLPYFFLLDENGTVIYSTKGLYTEKKMEELETILDENTQ